MLFAMRSLRIPLTTWKPEDPSMLKKFQYSTWIFRSNVETVPKINHLINATIEVKYIDHSLVHDFHMNQVTASGGDEIPVRLFQILKDDAVKVLHSICQKIWKIEQWPQEWKSLVFIQILKKENAKECSNYGTTVLISHASKVILKILQASLQQYGNRPQMYKLDLEKAEEPEIKLPTSTGSSKKQESSRKTSISAF